MTYKQEYLVTPQNAWVKSLEEEQEINSSETPPNADIALEGYHIVFDKKVTLMPADLSTTEIPG